MGGFFITGNNDGRLTSFLWSNYDELRSIPVQEGLPRPEENHTKIRGLLRQAIWRDSFVQVSRSLFKPHYGMQLVLMLAKREDYERVYFLAYSEGVGTSEVGYKERHINEGKCVG